MSGTCVSKMLLSAAGANGNGVLSVTPLLDPADPQNANNPAMKLYKEQVAEVLTPDGRRQQRHRRLRLDDRPRCS